LLTIIAFGISQFDFALILNLFLLQAWFPQYVMAYNGPAWFLSVQVFFYAIFPIILYYIKKQNYKPYHMIFILTSPEFRHTYEEPPGFRAVSW
jgi:peptidoglycan/LPS O-acetylase OafA/YrhL